MTASKRAARAVADLSAGVILAVVEIDVPPDRVFRALTDPEELKRWWGSADTYRTTDARHDMRVGGRWQSSGLGDDGTPFSVGGEIVAFDPPRALSQTWRADWDGGHETTLHYRLEPTPTGTRLTVRHEGFVGRAASCDGHAQGWERVLGWLDAHLGSRDSAEADTKADASAKVAAPSPAPPLRYFFCRLRTPRATFPADITAEERQMMDDHAGYWRGFLAPGTAIVFGPVADPAGAWGLGVLRTKDEATARELLAHDPAVLSGRGFSYEMLPLMSALCRD